MQDLVSGSNVMKKYNLDLLFSEKYEWKAMGAVRMND